jgi:hypothetical protein
MAVIRTHAANLATAACLAGALYSFFTLIAWRGAPSMAQEIWGEVLDALADLVILAGCLVAAQRFLFGRPHALRPLLPAAGLHGLLQTAGALLAWAPPGPGAAADLMPALPFLGACGLALAAWVLWVRNAQRTAAGLGLAAAVLWTGPHLLQPAQAAALQWVALVAVAAAGVAFAWRHLEAASAVRLGAALLAGTAWLWQAFAAMSESGGFTLPEAAFVAQALAGAFTLLAGIVGLLAGWRAHPSRPRPAT